MKDPGRQEAGVADQNTVSKSSSMNPIVKFRAASRLRNSLKTV